MLKQPLFRSSRAISRLLSAFLLIAGACTASGSKDKTTAKDDAGQDVGEPPIDLPDALAVDIVAPEDLSQGPDVAVVADVPTDVGGSYGLATCSQVTECMSDGKCTRDDCPVWCASQGTQSAQAEYAAWAACTAKCGVSGLDAATCYAAECFDVWGSCTGQPATARTSGDAANCYTTALTNGPSPDTVRECFVTACDGDAAMKALGLVACALSQCAVSPGLWDQGGAPTGAAECVADAYWGDACRSKARWCSEDACDVVELPCQGRSCGTDGPDDTACGACAEGGQCLANGQCWDGALVCVQTSDLCEGDDLCACVGCANDGVCTAEGDDCYCDDCADEPLCAGCNGDGVCNPYLEGCGCSDCAGLPACCGPKCTSSLCGPSGACTGPPVGNYSGPLVLALTAAASGSTVDTTCSGSIAWTMTPQGPGGKGTCTASTPVGDVVVSVSVLATLTDSTISGKLNMSFDYNVGGTAKGTGTSGFSADYTPATSTLSGTSSNSYPMKAGALTLTAKSGTLSATPAP